MTRIVSYATIFEPALFLLVGFGLISIATVVRYVLAHAPLPKPHRMMLWVGQIPDEPLLIRGSHVSQEKGKAEKAAMTFERSGGSAQAREVISTVQ